MGYVAVRERAVDTWIQYGGYDGRRGRITRRHRVREGHDGAGRLVEQFERRLGHNDELEQRATNRQPCGGRPISDGAVHGIGSVPCGVWRSPSGASVARYGWQRTSDHIWCE